MYLVQVAPLPLHVNQIRALLELILHLAVQLLLAQCPLDQGFPILQHQPQTVINQILVDSKDDQIVVLQTAAQELQKYHVSYQFDRVHLHVVHHQEEVIILIALINSLILIS